MPEPRLIHRSPHPSLGLGIALLLGCLTLGVIHLVLVSLPEGERSGPRPPAPPVTSETGTPPGDQVITIRADYWPPFNGEPGSAAPGYMIEMATAIFAKAGYRVDYQTMPWARAIEMTRAGEFDAIVGAFKTDVPDFIFPDAELGVAETIFLVRTGTAWRFDGLGSLARVKIGIVKDYGYGQLMDDYVREHADHPERIEVIYGEDVVARNLHKLALGRLDATVDVRAVLDYTIAKEGLAGRFVEAGTISTDRVYLAFSPRRATSRAYAELLAKGVAELRASGALPRILARYGGRDWQ